MQLDDPFPICSGVQAYADGLKVKLLKHYDNSLQIIQINVILQLELFPKITFNCPLCPV
jgi:hypothetical protein